MSFDKQANAQAVHDKLIEIRTHVGAACGLCHDLTCEKALEMFENANPQASLDFDLDQQFQKLHVVANDFPKLITHTTNAGAKTRIIKREDVSSKDSAMIDPTEVVVQGFEMFPPEVKKETLKRLLGCINDPPKAVGQDGVDTVVALFKILDPEEKKELFKRLIDL